MASHAFLEHTGETRMLVQAASLEELFAESARGLGKLEREDIATLGDPAVGTFRVSAPDLAALMVDWLNELVYWCETETAVPEVVTVRMDGFGGQRDSPRRLDATVSGARLAHRPALVKAATHHGLRCEPTAGGWEAEVVLDV